MKTLNQLNFKMDKTFLRKDRMATFTDGKTIVKRKGETSLP